MILDDGRDTDKLAATFDKLLEVAELVAPKLAQQMRVGIYSAITDNDAIKVRLMVAVSAI
jgi:hypothetical protein